MLLGFGSSILSHCGVGAQSSSTQVEVRSRLFTLIPFLPCFPSTLKLQEAKKMGLLGEHSPPVLTFPGVPKDEQFPKQMATEPFPCSVGFLPCLCFLGRLYWFCLYSKIQVVVRWWLFIGNVKEHGQMGSVTVTCVYVC